MGRYRSTAELPMPQGWERKAFGAYRYVVLPLFCALVMAPLVSGAAWTGLTDPESRFAALLGLSLLGPACAAFSIAAWSAIPRVAPVAAELLHTDSGPALVVPVPRPSSRGSVVAIAFGVLLLGAGLWYFVGSLGEDWGSGLALLFLISLPASVAILLGSGTYTSRAARDRAGIVLTPQSVTIDHGKDPTRLDWDDITAVGGRRERKGWGTPTNLICLVLGDEARGYRSVDIRHDDLATDPLRLYHLFVFYVRHPQRRSELGTEAALERFRSADYRRERPPIPDSSVS